MMNTSAQPQGGTNFHREQDAHREPRPSLAPRGRIMVVDDDQHIRATLRMALEDEGYAVCEAENGAVALDLLRRTHTPHVVVLDQRMPRLSGDGLLQRVSSDERLPARHRFLLVTANHDRLSPPSLHLLKRMHAPVIPKPFNLDDLLDNVAHEAHELAAAAS